MIQAAPLSKPPQPIPELQSAVLDCYNRFVERLNQINPGKTPPSIPELLEFAGEDLTADKISGFGALLTAAVKDLPFETDYYFELLRPLRHFYTQFQFSVSPTTPLFGPTSAVQILAEVMTCSIDPSLAGYAEECELIKEETEEEKQVKLLGEFKRDASQRLKLYERQTTGLSHKLSLLTEERTPEEISQLLEDSGMLAKMHSEISRRANLLTQKPDSPIEDARIAGADDLSRFSAKVVELAEERQPELAKANELKEAALTSLSLVSIESWVKFISNPKVPPNLTKMITQSLQKLRDHPKKPEDIGAWAEKNSNLAESRLRPMIDCEFTFCVQSLEELLHHASTKEFNFEPIRKAKLMAPLVYWMINNPERSPF